MRVVQLILRTFLLMVLASVLAYAFLRSGSVPPLEWMLYSVRDLTAEDYLRLRAAYGLDAPLPYIAYFDWAAQVFRGQLGYSFQYGIPVANLLLPRLQNTLILVAAAVILGWGGALLFGVITGRKLPSWIGYIGRGVALLGSSLPAFWLGVLLIVLFSVNLRWLPPGGLMSSDVRSDFWSLLIDRAKYVIMPAFVLAFTELTAWVRYTQYRWPNGLAPDDSRMAPGPQWRVHSHGCRFHSAGVKVG